MNSIRNLILSVLTDTQLQNQIILHDPSRNLSVSVLQLKSIITNFIRKFLLSRSSAVEENENNENNGGEELVQVVALEISDIFPLAITEIACAVAGVTFVPLDYNDPETYRSRQKQLCGVSKTITQSEVDAFLSPTSTSSSSSSGENQNTSNNDDEFIIPARASDSNPLYYIFTSGSTLTAAASASSSTIHQESDDSSQKREKQQVKLPKCLVVHGESLLTYLKAIHEAFLSSSSSLSSNATKNFRKRILVCLSSPTFDPSIGDIFSLFYCLSLTPTATATTATMMTTLVCPSRNQILNDVTQVLSNVIMMKGENSGGADIYIISSPALWKNVSFENLVEKNHQRFAFQSSLFVALGGEAIPNSLIEKWRSKINFFAIYGLTEGTIYQNLRRFPSSEQQQLPPPSSIKNNIVGTPLSSEIEIFLLPQPTSSFSAADQPKHEDGDEETDFLTGELVIVSSQVVSGMLSSSSSENNKNSNNKRSCCLIPFETYSQDPKKRILKTGDLVRVPKADLLFVSSSSSSAAQVVAVRDDELIRINFSQENVSSIELLGRLDFQVKISGRRVSLEDVENTVEYCLKTEVQKCVCIVNERGTGIVGVVLSSSVQLRQRQQRQNQQDTGEWALLQNVFCFVANLSLRVRERLTEVFIWDEDKFPVTKNGKTDRKAIADKYFSTRRSSLMTMQSAGDTMQEDSSEQQSSVASQSSSAFSNHHPKSAVQHQMQIELQFLIREIWSEALGIDQSLLTSKNSNFFVLGGDSLLCVKVSRELMYAIFPEEADDRTLTTPKRRQRKGDVAEFLKQFRPNNNKKKQQQQQQRQQQEEYESSSKNVDDADGGDSGGNEDKSKLSLQVDEFGKFKGPIEPQLIFQYPSFENYCTVAWREICKFVSISPELQKNESASESASSNLQQQQNIETSIPSATSSPQKQQFTELLTQAIDEGDASSMSVLLNYSACLKPLGIENPSQQLGVWIFSTTTGDSADQNQNNSNKLSKALKKKGAAAAVAKGQTVNSDLIRIAFPLHHAIQRNNLQLVKILVQRFGCKPTDFTPSQHVTALHIASQLQPSSSSSDPTQILKFLIEEANGPLHVRDSRFQTLLHYSCRAGVVETTRWLLKKSRTEEQEKTKNKNQKRSTQVKVEDLHQPFIVPKMLLERDRWQRTPLHWAIVNNHISVVRLLVEEGEGKKILINGDDDDGANQVQVKSEDDDDDAVAVDVVANADRSMAQLVRLSHHRTQLPYETPLCLATRLYGEQSEMVRIVKLSSLN